MHTSIENEKNETTPETIGTDYSYKHKVNWFNASIFLVLHLLGLWGVSIAFTRSCQWLTIFWTFIYGYASGKGITVGAHRFYTHKTFKAKPGLRAFLLFLQTINGQNSMYTWARDHRVHHKYSDTDADPHNAKRGFFFSHIGWLMCSKHPFIKKYGEKVDMSDLEADWMIRFQRKYFMYLYILVGIIIPVLVPAYLWNETWLNSIIVSYFGRYMLTLNATWAVNSLAHLYGTRPYDRKLQPVESWFVSFLTSGEGFHNYHHAFPWDYKCAELTTHLNGSAQLIRFFERMGWAYDLKTVSPEMLKKRIARTGDGSHYQLGTDEGRAAVTAFGPVHPINPLYNTTLEPPAIGLKSDGCPLYTEDDNFIILRTTTAG